VRFEVTEDECLRQWTVVVDNGDIEVTRGESDADAVVRADRELFDRVVRGEENLVSAAFRGEVTWTGSLDLIAQAGWLLPGPAGQTGPRKIGGTGRATE
jgi:putative sterol carrier protein